MKVEQELPKRLPVTELDVARRRAPERKLHLGLRRNRQQSGKGAAQSRLGNFPERRRQVFVDVDQPPQPFPLLPGVVDLVALGSAGGGRLDLPAEELLPDQLAEPAASPRVDHRHMGLRRSREPPPQIIFEAAVSLNFVGGENRHAAAGFDLHFGRKLPRRRIPRTGAEPPVAHHKIELRPVASLTARGTLLQHQHPSSRPVAAPEQIAAEKLLTGQRRVIEQEIVMHIGPGDRFKGTLRSEPGSKSESVHRAGTLFHRQKVIRGTHFSAI